MHILVAPTFLSLHLLGFPTSSPCTIRACTSHHIEADESQCSAPKETKRFTRPYSEERHHQTHLRTATDSSRNVEDRGNTDAPGDGLESDEMQKEHGSCIQRHRQAFQCAKHTNLQEVAEQIFREEDADLVKARHRTYPQMLTCDDARLGSGIWCAHRPYRAEFHGTIGRVITSGMETTPDSHVGRLCWTHNPVSDEIVDLHWQKILGAYI